MKQLLIITLIGLLSCQQGKPDPIHYTYLGSGGVYSLRNNKDTAWCRLNSGSYLRFKCSDNNLYYTYIATPDTTIIHDTIKVNDESDIESIKYYKTLSERLWRATELVQLNTLESDRELAILNHQIISDREKHNQAVTEATIATINQIITPK